MVEQRYLAVREVLDSGATMIDVAFRYGVDRRTLHRWLVRYANEGLAGLGDRSCKPHRCPHQINAVIEARLVELRREHLGWGPRTLRTKLAREFDVVPSRSAVYRALVRHCLIEPQKRKRRQQDYKRWERLRAMELWQMDVVGRIYLTDGTQLCAVTGIDDHSRFCVIAKLVTRATAKPVCDALIEGLGRHGIPQQILTDNGKVFTGKLARKPTNVLFDRICLNNGIKHILTAPYSPTTTGKVERLHRTMRKEFFDSHIFDTIEQTQTALDEWVISYNHDREHQSLGDMPPIKRFELAKQTHFEVIDGDITIEQEITVLQKAVKRRVDSVGRISILKNKYHVGRQYAREQVSVATEDGLLNVSHNGVVVATHAKRHLAEDDEKMLGRPKAMHPTKPTRGNEVARMVDKNGSVSFAGTQYRVSNKHKGELVGVRLVNDTIQITIDNTLIRTHKAKHDQTKEYGALAQPQGHKKANHNVA